MKRWIRVGIALAIFATLVVLAGQFLGRQSTEQTTAPAAGGEVWTCSMHPQVRLPKPGKCPICSMPLVPAKSFAKVGAGTGADGESMLTLSEHARAMASVETAPVERRKLSREIRAVGKVQYNESALSTITARVDGYIERLFIDYTGVEVKAGDHLVEIYNPELLVAQGELLMSPAQSGMIESVRRKLRRWEITDEQIDEVLRSRKPQDRVTISAPANGTVTEKMVVQKSAVKAGDVLYKLANLESVWVYLDIYEYELGSVRYGQTAEIATEAYPGETFTGRVWFINPVLTDESRTVKVLVNIANKDKRLKPGMFVSATIRAGLLANGQLAATGVEGKWTCLMHPQVLEAEGGPCPVCKMALTQIPLASTTPKPEGRTRTCLARHRCARRRHPQDRLRRTCAGRIPSRRTQAGLPCGRFLSGARRFEGRRQSRGARQFPPRFAISNQRTAEPLLRAWAGRRLGASTRRSDTRARGRGTRRPSTAKARRTQALTYG